MESIDNKQIIESTQPTNEGINQEINDDDSHTNKITFKKYAIIHGYNGHMYSGNQKNPGVKTIEEEIEKALYQSSFISKSNFGNFKKSNWMRASRTDKGVSAIMNVINCKLNKSSLINVLKMKEIVNQNLPSDIRIYRFIEVSETFDAKKTNNNREYIYILPSFMLEPLGDTHNDSTIDSYKGNYSFRIEPDLREKIESICKEFIGVKKYHNYTKKIPFSSPESSRHIFEMELKEIITYDSFEAVNSALKMIGMIIELCHNNRSIQYLSNSFLSNKMEIPLAPPDGLYLRRIDYSKYNEMKYVKKNNIFITDDDEEEMNQFEELTKETVEKRECDKSIFSQWQWRFDHMKESLYS